MMPSTVEQERLRDCLFFSAQEGDPSDPLPPPQTPGRWAHKGRLWTSGR